MEAPTVVQALAAWERGVAHGLVERGLALLALARPGVPQQDLAAASIGARDRALLDLREAMFGTEITGQRRCGACGELVETTLELGLLKLEAPATTPAEIALSIADYALTLRLLDSRDLMAASQAEDAPGRRAILLERCVCSATRSGVAVAPDDLPEAVVTELGRALALADPQADLELAITCPACSRKAQAPFDIVTFLWDELDAWAGRLLRDIHILATAYGWSEQAILALSPHRRRRYLELASG